MNKKEFEDGREAAEQCLSIPDGDWPGFYAALVADKETYALITLCFCDVEPNRSRLEAGDLASVNRDVDARWPAHVGEAWEDLARSTLPALRIHGRTWSVAARYWGKDPSGDQLELDLVARASRRSSSAATVTVRSASSRSSTTRSGSLRWDSWRNAFVEMWKYLYGEEPRYTEIQCGQDPIIFDGKAVTLGDNVIRANAKIEVFEIDRLADPWERGEPVQTVHADANGQFRMELRRGIRYEFRQWDADGTLLGHVYYAPFKRSNYLARLLSESQNPTVKSATSDAIVRGAGHGVMAARYLAGVLRADWGNSLTIDGQEVLTADNAGKSSNVTGLFMFDANQNKTSDLGRVYNVSFLWGTDVYIDSSTPAWLDVKWTNEEGHTAEFKVPNWDSGPPASGNALDRNLAALYLPH